VVRSGFETLGEGGFFSFDTVEVIGSYNWCFGVG
jgi:hypothetical protein